MIALQYRQMLTNKIYIDNNNQSNQNGNVMVIILLAIVLLGALSVALQGTSSQNAHIDNETLIIRASEVQRYASELERGVSFIMQNGFSESDIRFAHPDANADYGDLSADSDKSDQLFSREGGAAKYRPPPDGINDGSLWEFYGNTALPEVGSNAADLIAVLPNVTQAFCEKINAVIGYDTTIQPTDSATCINSGAAARFDDSTQFALGLNAVNTVVEATFSLKPSMSGCVQCTSDNSYHFFHVLMAR